MVRMITGNTVLVTVHSEDGRGAHLHLKYGDRVPDNVTAECLEHLILLGFVSRDVTPEQ